MIKKLVFGALWVGIGAASCAKNPAPRDTPSQLNNQARADAKPQPAKQAGAAAEAAAPSIPAGAEWTIYCTTVPGAAHVAQSTQLRDELARTTGMRDWYVIHGASESTLYYGFYKTIDKNAKAAREKIDAMKDTAGGRPFRNALIIELTPPDPDAPAQWDLANAPPGMEWSVQIAAYEGGPQRKKFAVDAVREARAQGVPAYYYHGPSISSVCVGAWPKQAVRGSMEPAFNDPTEKRPLEQVLQQQPADLIVLPPGMPGANREIQTPHGRVRTVSSQLEVVDPTMLATMKAYPNHYHNGEAEGVNTKEGVKPKPSFLVKIPRRSGSILGGGELAGGGRQGAAPEGAGPTRTSSDVFQLTQPAGERRPAQPAPATPGYGKLPSLGGN